MSKCPQKVEILAALSEIRKHTETNITCSCCCCSTYCLHCCYPSQRRHQLARNKQFFFIRFIMSKKYQSTLSPVHEKKESVMKERKKPTENCADLDLNQQPAITNNNQHSSASQQPHTTTKSTTMAKQNHKDNHKHRRGNGPDP
jgi:hypothetical protein